jgi:hypothetical protein
MIQSNQSFVVRPERHKVSEQYCCPRSNLRADLDAFDAFDARAYGLTRDELRHTLDRADVKGPDDPSETFRVLKEKEIRHHGEYRTRRFVLAAWDRMEADGEFAAMRM